MDKKKLLIFAAILVALYFGWQWMRSAFQTEEDAIKNVIAQLTEAFSERHVGHVQDHLTEDFYLSYFGRSMSYRDMSNNLRGIFIRGNSIIISGSVDRITIEEDRANVIWRGTVHTEGKVRGFRDRGTGELEFIKSDGEWLLEKATVVEANTDIDDL